MMSAALPCTGVLMGDWAVHKVLRDRKGAVALARDQRRVAKDLLIAEQRFGTGQQSHLTRAPRGTEELPQRVDGEHQGENVRDAAPPALGAGEILTYTESIRFGCQPQPGAAAVTPNQPNPVLQVLINRRGAPQGRPVSTQIKGGRALPDQDADVLQVCTGQDACRERCGCREGELLSIKLLERLDRAILAHDDNAFDALVPSFCNRIVAWRLVENRVVIWIHVGYIVFT